MTRRRSPSRAPSLLVAGFALFLVAIAYLLASSLVRRQTRTFEPTPVATARSDGDALRTDTVTVDASDPRTWRFFDFDQGARVEPPDTAGWDLAIRRYHVIAAGAIADLGPLAFDGVERVPRADFIPNAAGRDTVNPAIRHWYDYGMLTHLLESSRHVYLVRTRDRRYAKLEVVSYYCTGLRPGCMTFRYAYPLSPIDATP